MATAWLRLPVLGPSLALSDDVEEFVNAAIRVRVDLASREADDSDPSGKEPSIPLRVAAALFLRLVEVVPVDLDGDAAPVVPYEEVEAVSTVGVLDVGLDAERKSRLRERVVEGRLDRRQVGVWATPLAGYDALARTADSPAVPGAHDPSGSRERPVVRAPDPLTATTDGMRCAECGRDVDEFTVIRERWGFWSDRCGELTPFCPQCATREFSPEAPRSPVA